MPSERKVGTGIVSAVVREAQLRPWRTIEHCALIILALHLAFNTRKFPASTCPSGRQTCCCSAAMAGPQFVFGLPDVTAAPQPSMSLAQLKPGETAQHHDFRGDIYRLPLGDNVTVNLMRTTAGTMRSGDLHNCTQYDVILRGRAKLHTYDVRTGQEATVLYDANELIQIPARMPHLFEFLDENYMLEWWACEFAAWYYKPYRDRIAQSFARNKAAYTQVAAKASSGGAGAQKAATVAPQEGKSGKQQERMAAGPAGELQRANAQKHTSSHPDGGTRPGSADQLDLAGSRPYEGAKPG